ncbi:MAG TPA: mechanosensitive ion channel domain-containing protein, partial [Ktedonobacterales bacterium]|nr:mechanosensitive ion channel domain-containing protein [Ktedonobacterales bacterium]
MVSQYIAGLFSGVMVPLGNQSASPSMVGSDWVAVRVGATLFILLIALLLGPRIARSVGRVPALIENARERRLARQEAGDEEEGVYATESAHEEPPEQQTGMSRWLSGVVLICIWALALYLIGVTWFAEMVLDGARREALLLALRQFSLDLGVSMLIIVVTLVVARALQKSLVASLRRGRVNGNLVVLAGRTIFTVTLVVGVIAILSVWGLGIALPVTLIGAVTVALSFALQDILKNLVSGIYLLLERPFVIGDQITIAPYTGVVEDISIRFSALRTSSGERVLVPN